tara:strand:+ start:2614 stop:2946 length:333 start_codon:yes stop_codon:yes gene_type:complete
MGEDDKNDDDMKKLFVDIVLNSTETAERILDFTKTLIENEKLPAHVVPSSLIFAGVLSMIEAAAQHGENHKSVEFLNSMYWMIDLALESYTSIEGELNIDTDEINQKTLH